MGGLFSKSSEKLEAPPKPDFCEGEMLYDTSKSGQPSDGSAERVWTIPER